MSETIDHNHNPRSTRRPRGGSSAPSDGRWLGGVCAGLGRYFDVNPLVYRIAFAALALAGGTGLLLYLAAYLVIPDEHADESIAVEALRTRRDQPWLLLGVGLLGFGALFALSEARFWPGTGNFWLAAVLAGAALVWWHVSSRDRPMSTASAADETAPPAAAGRSALRERRGRPRGRRSSPPSSARSSRRPACSACSRCSTSTTSTSRSRSPPVSRSSAARSRSER